MLVGLNLNVPELSIQYVWMKFSLDFGFKWVLFGLSTNETDPK